MEIDQETLNELGAAVTDMIEAYGDKLPPYEIGHLLISNAVSLMLHCAPNHLVAIKTILSCVENGIVDFETNHLNKK